MGLIAWLKGKSGNSGINSQLDSWRQAWHKAAAEPDAGGVEALRASLLASAASADDIEVEQEMLEGLAELVALRDAVSAQGLPLIQTGHRVVGADRCHFSATASMPDDASQPAGRLLLTDGRAIFVGGARAVTVAWHAVSEVAGQDRDVILVHHDRETAYRFRCNTYGDALAAAFLARQLAPKQPRGSRSV